MSDSSWRPLMIMTAAHRALPKPRKLGGKAVMRPQILVMTKGHEAATLYDGEPERARAWAGRIVQRMPPRS